MDESRAVIKQLKVHGHPQWAGLWERDLERLEAAEQTIRKLAHAVEACGLDVEPLLGEST